MSANITPRKAVLTYVITGFLGVGKTTLIQSLLARRPKGERWGVLVNEFGEIGVDAALLAREGVQIKEVPGGCMCCVAGVPMQVALTRLLREAQLDCLLIEPTGLGHAPDILAQLRAAPFARALRLAKVFTLIDPAKLLDDRYRHHPVFMAQAQVADVIVATKVDCASAQALAALDEFVATLPQAPDLVSITQGNLPMAWLAPADHSPSSRMSRLAPVEKAAPEVWGDESRALAPNDYLSASKMTNTFSSIGWRFGAAVAFDPERLFAWWLEYSPLRGKAVINTAAGAIVFNISEGQIQRMAAGVEAVDESRIECIFDTRESLLSHDFFAALERQLLECVPTSKTLIKVE